jgi:hypothetical protein
MIPKENLIWTDIIFTNGGVTPNKELLIRFWEINPDSFTRRKEWLVLTDQRHK